jgi:hypothetical protein
MLSAMPILFQVNILSASDEARWKLFNPVFTWNIFFAINNGNKLVLASSELIIAMHRYILGIFSHNKMQPAW